MNEAELQSGDNTF